MSRPRIPIDVDLVLQLHSRGCSTREIVSRLKTSSPAGPPIDAKTLGMRLADYRSVEQSTEAMKTELKSLQPQVEELQKKGADLRLEIKGLEYRRSEIKEEVEDLDRHNQKLSRSIEAIESRKEHLEKYLSPLEDRVKALETREASLQKQNIGLERKVAGMEEILKASARLHEQMAEASKAIQDLDVKKKEAGRKFELFEGFLGLVGAASKAELAECIRLIPTLVEAAQQDKYDADFLRKLALEKMIGNSVLCAIVCNECGVEFVVVKRSEEKRPGIAYDSKPKYCPICMSSRVRVEQEIGQILQNEFKPVEVKDVKEGPKITQIIEKRQEA